MFLVGIDSLPKCYSGKHFLSPRAQIALLFGPREICLPNLGPPLVLYGYNKGLKWAINA